MKVDDLVAGVVADENEEGAVGVLDAGLDESGDAGVELFAHGGGGQGVADI